jgi:hypothetical protein
LEDSGSVLLTKNYSGAQIEENQKGESCGTKGREEMRTEFRCKNLREKDHLEDLGVDRKKY